MSTLSTQVKDKVAALTGLYTRLEEIKTYMNQVPILSTVVVRASVSEMFPFGTAF